MVQDTPIPTPEHWQDIHPLEPDFVPTVRTPDMSVQPTTPGEAPRGMTADGWEHIKARCSAGGDWFENWKPQIEASSNGCISIQTGYSELDNLLIANFNALPPFTAGWNDGQVLVGKDAASYFAALDPAAKAALALMLTAGQA